MYIFVYVLIAGRVAFWLFSFFCKSIVNIIYIYIYMYIYIYYIYTVICEWVYVYPYLYNCCIHVDTKCYNMLLHDARYYTIAWWSHELCCCLLCMHADGYGALHLLIFSSLRLGRHPPLRQQDTARLINNKWCQKTKNELHNYIDTWWTSTSYQKYINHVLKHIMYQKLSRHINI